MIIINYLSTLSLTSFSLRHSDGVVLRRHPWQNILVSTPRSALSASLLLFSVLLLFLVSSLSLSRTLSHESPPSHLSILSVIPKATRLLPVDTPWEWHSKPVNQPTDADTITLNCPLLKRYLWIGLGVVNCALPSPWNCHQDIFLRYWFDSINRIAPRIISKDNSLNQVFCFPKPTLSSTPFQRDITSSLYFNNAFILVFGHRMIQ